MGIGQTIQDAVVGSYMFARDQVGLVADSIVRNPAVVLAQDKLNDTTDYVGRKINRPEDMEGVYSRHAQETYGQINSDIAQAVRHSGDLPVFVMSGEMHSDSELDKAINNFIPDKYENPALAAAYTHIAAIHAAGELVGKENVIVSVEYNQENLDLSKSHAFEDSPVQRAIHFANEQGYELVASDPMVTNADDPQARYDAEIETIGQHALRTEDPPKIVVHLGGAAHIGTLQGYTKEELLENGEDLIRDPARNPFNGIYGQTLFYNTAQATPVTLIGEVIDDRFNYLKNPENATQINPPGRMMEIDSFNVVNQVLGLPLDTRTEEERIMDVLYDEPSFGLSEDAFRELEKELGLNGESVAESNTEQPLIQPDTFPKP